MFGSVICLKFEDIWSIQRYKAGLYKLEKQKLATLKMKKY